MKSSNYYLIGKCFFSVFFIMSLVGFMVGSVPSVYGNTDYETHTHDNLNRLGAELVDRADGDDNLYAEIYAHIPQLQRGGVDEDNGFCVPEPRPLHHFYHPYSGGGLAPRPGASRYTDAVTWARNSSDDLTWAGAINTYDYPIRSKLEAYVRLGHVAHLVGDMAQPDHVHVEPHIHGLCILYLPVNEWEPWVKEYWGLLGPDLQELHPNQLSTMEEHLTQLAKITYDNSSFYGGTLAEDPPYIDSSTELARMFRVGRSFAQWELYNWLAVDSSEKNLGNWDGEYSSDDNFWLTTTEVTETATIPEGRYYIEEIVDAIPVEYKGEQNFNCPLPGRHSCPLGYFYAKKFLPLAVENIAGLYQHYYDIVNHPPYVYRVTVAQNGQCLYQKFWADDTGGRASIQVVRRKLIQSCNTPSFIDETQERVDIQIEFGSKALGTAKKMREDSVDVAFVDEDGGVCTATGKLDDSGMVWIGGFDLSRANGCAVDDVLTIRIEAKDRHNHYPGRSPLGDELDQSPDTPAKAVITGTVDSNAPLQYEWKGYEPGMDTNHRIDPEPRDEACNGEVNVIVGQTDGMPIEGTCGPDEVKADEVYTDEDNQDDDIKTYAGDDVIFADFTGINVPLIGGYNVVDAGPGNDKVMGGGFPDELYGGPGNDELIGYDGDDLLDGGEGNDSLITSGPYSGPYYWHAEQFGGPGNDELTAPANAYLDGGEGNDRLSSGDHSTLVGGAGNDILHTSGESEANGGPGDDFLSYYSGTTGFQAELEGGSGDDVIYVYSSGKSRQVLVEGGGIFIDGGSGADAYVFGDVGLLNGITFTGGYDGGSLYYGSAAPPTSTERSLLQQFLLWDTYHYTATYDAFTSVLTVTVLAGEDEVAASVNAQQPVAIFTVEYFHNGMLGINGVEGAPDSPFDPVLPTSDIIYLPLIQNRP